MNEEHEESTDLHLHLGVQVSEAHPPVLELLHAVLLHLSGHPL